MKKLWPTYAEYYIFYPYELYASAKEDFSKNFFDKTEKKQW